MTATIDLPIAGEPFLGDVDALVTWQTQAGAERPADAEAWTRWSTRR